MRIPYPLLVAVSLLLPACQNHLPVPATPEVIAKMTKPDDEKHPITVVTGDYRGGFRLDKSGQLFEPDKPFYLTAGTHTFDVGGVARSDFSFEVTPCGNVANVSNPKAAHPKGSQLILRTTPVTVDASLLGKGGNACELAAYPGRLDGRKTFPLIPALVYQFDSGIRTGSSSFLFEVREDGTVWGDRHSGNGSEKQLNLHVGWIDVSTEASAIYQIGRSRSYTGSKRVPVIFGLLTYLKVNEQAVYFTPEYGSFPRKLSVGGRSFTVTVPWDQ
ncbi:MAG: hypothetical protein RLZZ214_177 [Verrucomicrobiota bacterium]|jgi:hypothetical protein